jgi:hypothetical protein
MFYAVIVGKHLTLNVDAILVFETVIVNEGEHSSAGELNSGGGYPSGSMTALCKMEKGDHAWIRTTGVTGTHAVYSKDNYPQSAFLRLLIDNMS